MPPGNATAVGLSRLSKSSMRTRGHSLDVAMASVRTSVMGWRLFLEATAFIRKSTISLSVAIRAASCERGGRTMSRVGSPLKWAIRRSV